MFAKSIAFLQVDLDDLWAIADCYGFEAPHRQEHFVYRDALPRFRRLFDELHASATFFAAGRDLEDADNVGLLQTLHSQGHRFANHSWSHPLNFRELAPHELIAEIAPTEELLQKALGVRPLGFRAPGYGISRALVATLTDRGYRYDSSIMPSPYGFVFRWLDARLRRSTTRGRRIHKTQFPAWSDARAPLAPYRISPECLTRETPGAPLLEIPAAVSPLLRLPFQAGVCMRLGRRYFDRALSAFRHQPEIPMLFLMHGADLADFNELAHPFFNSSRFFSQSIDQKLSAMQYFLSTIIQHYRVTTVEEWLG